MTVELSPEIEAQIRERAAASGQDVEAFVLQAVAEKLADAESQSKPASRSHEEWKKKLHAWIDLHPVVTHFVDDSRGSSTRAAANENLARYQRPLPPR